MMGFQRAYNSKVLTQVWVGEAMEELKCEMQLQRYEEAVYV